jgi:hypothetical protein
MVVKTTGLEFKRFYFDEAYWKDIDYVDDDLIMVDGVEWDPDREKEDIPNESKVVIEGGYLVDHSGERLSESFEAFFKKWKKLSNRKILIVSIPKDRESRLKELLKEVGGKIEN